MKQELQNLARLLRAEQLALLEAAARQGAVPAARNLERIAHLELTLSAVENTLVEMQ